ncbi:unannotated protein [freshwater metagenome]|uniref:Unannotated protein n=1 Tax=freshwater metagenome TaxID=449393 RepID=A0A6J6S945_9ZZZZ
MLTFSDARIEQCPRFGALLARVPAPHAVPERQDALLGTGLVLIAPSASERSVEAVLADGVEQRDRLQAVAARTRAGVLDHATGVNASLHTRYHEAHAPLLHEVIPVGDYLVEVVTRIDVHDREREPSGCERQHGEVQQHGRILATAEQQHRVHALGGHLTDNGDGLVGECIKVSGLGVRGGRVAHTCSPHSVLALPAQRPARLSSPGATGRVHGQQPMLG